MKTYLLKSPMRMLLCPALVLCLPLTIQAQFTWNGGDGSSQDWSTGSNWVGGDAPVSATDTVLVFQGSNNTGTAGTPLNQNIDTIMDVDSIQINQPAGQSFHLGGGTLRLNPTDPTTGISRFGGPTPGSETHTFINNNIILAADARFTINDDGLQRAMFYNGTVNLGSHTLSLNTTVGSNRIHTFNNTISGTGGIVIAGPTGVRFNTTNTFEGGFTYNQAVASFTLQLGADNALGTGLVTILSRSGPPSIQMVGSATSITLDNDFLIGHLHETTHIDRTMRFQGVFNLNGNFELGGVYAAGKGLELQTASTVVTINGVISQENQPRGLNLTSGPGTLVVTNENNTYTGATVVGRTDVAGHTPTLIVNGNIASSSLVTVHQGATLRGTGVTPGITVGSGGILAPGLQNGIGILAAEGDVLMQDGSVFEILVGDLANQSSLLAIGGGIDLEENVTLSLFGNLDGAYTIATFHTMATPYGTFTTVLLNGSSMEWEDSGYSIFYGSDSIQVIPEPGAASLFGVAMALLLLFRRRFRQVPS